MAARLRAPGFYRAGWMMVGAVAFATFLTWIVRMSTGHATFTHFISGDAILTVSLLAAPLAFLVGIGGFDYWFYWALGKKTLPEDHSGHGAYTWKDYFRINTDHKVIGIQYTVTSFFFLLVGGLLAMLMRAELAQPGAQFVDSNTFNGLFSVHASLLIFLFVIPVFAGLANFLVPLMIGAPDMAFPRLNALSYWLYLLAGVVLMLSFWAKGGAACAGWTSYPPLSTQCPGHGQDLWILSLHILGISSLIGAINFIVTIHNMRAPGMTWMRIPLFVWSIEVFAWLLVLVIPTIAAGVTMLLLDRQAGTHFFAPSHQGPILYQHAFWFFGHPEVYIMILPAMGIISEILPVFARKPIFGYKAIALSTVAIGFISMFG